MRDDQDFNLQFVGRVEAHPCLYDNTREDYHMTHVQERAWKKIAEEIGEGATTAKCKNRWMNLRGSYTKHIKKYIPSGSGASNKRPYYLAEYMAFILPFTRSRQAKGNIEAPTKKQAPVIFDTEDVPETQDSENSENEKDREEENSQMNDRDEDQPLNKEVASQKDLTASNRQDAHEGQPRTSPGRQKKVMQNSSVPLSEKNAKRSKIIQTRITLDDVNKSAFEYFEKKKQVPHRPLDISVNNNDGDAHFLLSLLPDVKKMTDKQKRRFKVGILNLAGQILDETSSEISATHSSAASTSNSLMMVPNLSSSCPSASCGHYTPSPIEEANSYRTYEDISHSKLIHSLPGQPSVANVLNTFYDNDA